MKYIELTDAKNGKPIYINVENVNAVFTDDEMKCTAVDMAASVLFVNEQARTILNTLYQANYDKGFLFHTPEEKDGE